MHFPFWANFIKFGWCEVRAILMQSCSLSLLNELWLFVLMAFMCEKLDSQVKVEPNMVSMNSATFLTFWNCSCWIFLDQNLTVPPSWKSSFSALELWISTSSNCREPSSTEDSNFLAFDVKSLVGGILKGSRRTLHCLGYWNLQICHWNYCKAFLRILSCHWL